MQAEHIIADSLPEVVWLRLKRLTSHQPRSKVIRARSDNARCGIDRDGGWNGMGRAVSGRLLGDEIEWSKRACSVSLLCAVTRPSIAEQIASGDETCILSSIEQHTEQGHGLFTIAADSDEFPANYLVGAMKSEHFPAYCKTRNLPVSKFSFERRLRKLPNDAERARLLSLMDLLHRVPELQSVAQESLRHIH